MRQVWASGGDPGGVCRASCTCCLSSLTHRGADSQDARGQLLTATTLDSPSCLYVPSLHGASRGQLLRACKDVSWGVAEVKELARKEGGVGATTVMGGVACLQQEVSVPVLQLYSPIITFTIQRQPGAHAQEVSGDHVTSAVCVPSATSTVTPPPTSAGSSLYSTCHLRTWPCVLADAVPEPLDTQICKKETVKMFYFFKSLDILFQYH